MATSIISSLCSPNRISEIGQTAVFQVKLSNTETESNDDIWKTTLQVFMSLECPFPGETNPYANIAEKRYQQWAQEMKIPSCEKYRPVKLMAGAYPHCSPEMLTTFTCLLIVIFNYDDQMERAIHECQRQPDELVLTEFNRKFIQALESGGVDHDEDDHLIKAAADVSKQFRSISTPEWRQRFMQDVKEYCEANYWESTKLEIPEMQIYFEKRPLVSSVYLFLDLCELSEGICIKDEMFNSQFFKDVRLACNHLIWMSNDIISFPKEAKGTGNNIIHVLMEKEKCSLNVAIEKTKSFYNDELAKLQSLLQTMPHEYGEDEKKLIHSLLFWHKSGAEWSIKTARYQKPQPMDLSWNKV